MINFILFKLFRKQIKRAMNHAWCDGRANHLHGLFDSWFENNY